MKDNEQNPCGVPKAIGLALSGGGARAAVFHLGALAYLDRVGLLPAVRMISTVSGGTLIGAAFALSRSLDQPFREFFREFYGNMQRVDLVNGALGHLGGPPNGRPSGRHDVVMSMAETYEDAFFRKPDGEPYRFDQLIDPDPKPATKPQLFDSVFNATEFRHGFAFRFQKTGMIGNRALSIALDDAKKIRIADIVAASTCFPGGFEPIAFPDDFAWPGNKVPSTVYDVVGEPVALMDGGIYDNQGIESLHYAERRGVEAGHEPLDMFVISDVDRGAEDIYPFPSPPATVGFLSSLKIGTVVWVARLLTLACIAIPVLIVLRDLTGHPALPYVLYVTAVVTAVVALIGFRKIRSTVSSELDKMFEAVPLAGKVLPKLRVGQVTEMARVRITSLVAMASSIFMYRIRSLGYQAIYATAPKDDEQEDVVRPSKAKLVSNRIDELLPTKRRGGTSDAYEFLEGSNIALPSPRLAEVVRIAAEMPTTLWFLHEYDQPCLAAAGQATLLYNLMVFVTRSCGGNPENYPDEIKELWDRLLSDWASLNEDPYSLLTETSPGEYARP